MTYDLETSFDGDYFVHGFHLTLEEAQAAYSDWTGEEPTRVVNIKHVYVRFGRLPEYVREEEGQRGWWVVEESGRGAKKATELWVKRSSNRYYGNAIKNSKHI